MKIKSVGVVTVISEEIRIGKSHSFFHILLLSVTPYALVILLTCFTKIDIKKFVFTKHKWKSGLQFNDLPYLKKYNLFHVQVEFCKYTTLLENESGK